MYELVQLLKDIQEEDDVNEILDNFLENKELGFYEELKSFVQTTDNLKFLETISKSYDCYMIEAIFQNKNCSREIFEKFFDDDEMIFPLVINCPYSEILDSYIFKEQDGEVLYLIFKNKNVNEKSKEKILKNKNFKNYIKEEEIEL